MVLSATGTVESPGVNVPQKRALNQSISAQGWWMIRRRLYGKVANADFNAAANILTAGLAVTARKGTSQRGPDEMRTLPGAA
jgi:hypothetical protein